jgi:hypothetical protein
MACLADIRRDRSRSSYSHDCSCACSARQCPGIFRTYRYSRELACSLPLTRTSRCPRLRFRLRLLRRCSENLPLLRILSGIQHPRFPTPLCRKCRTSRMPTRASLRARRTTRARSPSPPTRDPYIPPFRMRAPIPTGKAASTGDPQSSLPLRQGAGSAGCVGMSRRASPSSAPSPSVHWASHRPSRERCPRLTQLSRRRNLRAPPLSFRRHDGQPASAAERPPEGRGSARPPPDS